jgi:probable F420-dependent oxidoreductase
VVDVGINLQHLPSGHIADDVATIARGAEEIGLHSIWVSEHIVLPAHIETKDPYNEGGRLPFEIDTIYPESMVLLGYLAGATTTLRLGTYVVPVIARDPLSLAKQAATVDVLSSGRLELGVGAGYLIEEAALLGHPSDHPAERLAETIEIMRKAWAQPVFEHAGRFWQIPPVAVRPPPVQQTLPVWVGGSSASALAPPRGSATACSSPRPRRSRWLECARASRPPAGLRPGAPAWHRGRPGTGARDL